MRIISPLYRLHRAFNIASQAVKCKVKRTVELNLETDLNERHLARSMEQGEAPLRCPPWGAAKMRKCPTGRNLVSLSCEPKSNQGGPWSRKIVTENEEVANILTGKNE